MLDIPKIDEKMSIEERVFLKLKYAVPNLYKHLPISRQNTLCTCPFNLLSFLDIVGVKMKFHFNLDEYQELKVIAEISEYDFLKICGDKNETLEDISGFQIVSYLDMANLPDVIIKNIGGIYFWDRKLPESVKIQSYNEMYKYMRSICSDACLYFSISDRPNDWF
jgi:hypothetical protein